MTGVTPAQLLRPEVLALSAYHVPEARGLVKLDAMENPYGWPPEWVADWLDALRHTPLNRYPDPGAADLKTRLRTAFALSADTGLLLGNGSDELIQLLILAVAGCGRPLLAPEPTFVMYRLIAAFTGMDYIGVPLRESDFSLDLDAMLAAIARHRPALIFLADPNNPTGNRFDPAAVRAIIEAAPGLVVVDEAYFPFTDHSVLPERAQFDSLLVLRTLSKMGLAGLRLGFLLGALRWREQFEKQRLPYNIHVLTQISAAFALDHVALLTDQARRIRADRERLAAALASLPGVTVFPSATNFLLLRVAAGDADCLFNSLHKAGVLIKNLHRSGESLRDCLRVTVGTPEENQAFLTALRAAL